MCVMIKICCASPILRIYSHSSSKAIQSAVQTDSSINWSISAGGFLSLTIWSTTNCSRRTSRPTSPTCHWPIYTTTRTILTINKTRSSPSTPIHRPKKTITTTSTNSTATNGDSTSTNSTQMLNWFPVRTSGLSWTWKSTVWLKHHCTGKRTSKTRSGTKTTR